MFQIDHVLDERARCDLCRDECCLLEKCPKQRRITKRKLKGPLYCEEESGDEIKQKRMKNRKAMKDSFFEDKLLFSERGDEEDWIWEL